MPYIPLSQIKESIHTKSKYWIVFTGDSITSCEWVHPNWRDIVIYVLHSELTDLFHGDWKPPGWCIKGFNFAYDGATTRDITNRLDDILLLKPQLVIGLMGGNDPTFKISPEQSVNNIERISREVVESGSQIVWCSSTPAGKGSRKNEEYRPYAEGFMKIPSKNDFFKIDMFNLYQKFPLDRIFTFVSEENLIENIKEGEVDLQHPNQLGNAYIAKVILKEVFDVSFDPEKYISDTLDGAKFPGY